MPYDIQPAVAEHGGHNILMRGLYDATVPYTVGDLVFRNNDGQIEGFPADTTQAILADMDSGRVCGVAASPGVDPSTGTALINPRTGAAYVADDEVLFWPADHGIIFKTDIVITAGGTGVSVPAGSIVGESFQLTFDTLATRAGWGVELTAGVQGTDVCAIVHAVLDSRGRPISSTDTTTGVWVLFEIKTNA